MSARVAIAVAEEDPRTPDVAAMIAALDALALELYPAESCHLASPEDLVARGACFLVARIDRAAAGCGALLPDVDGAGEIKRMWTDPAQRRRGVGRAIVRALEARARALGLPALRLETGPAQPEALALYESEGFVRRGPFADYPADDPNSIFYEKTLLPAQESAA